MDNKQKLVTFMSAAFLTGCGAASIGWYRRVKKAGRIKEMSNIFGMKLDLLQDTLKIVEEAEDGTLDPEKLQKWFAERKEFINIIEESM